MIKHRIGNDLPLVLRVYRDTEAGIPELENFTAASQISVIMSHIHDAHSVGFNLPITFEVKAAQLEVLCPANPSDRLGMYRAVVTYTKAGKVYTFDFEQIQFVQTSEEANHDNDTEVILTGAVHVNRDGANAYELWKSFNPDSTLTEQQWSAQNDTNRAESEGFKNEAGQSAYNAAVLADTVLDLKNDTQTLKEQADALKQATDLVAADTLLLRNEAEGFKTTASEKAQIATDAEAETLILKGQTETLKNYAAGYSETAEQAKIDTVAQVGIASTKAGESAQSAIEAKAYRDAAASMVTFGPAMPPYADLAALIAANPDHARTHLSIDNGNWNYWNGSTFVAGGAYQTVADYALKADAKRAESKTKIRAFDLIQKGYVYHMVDGHGPYKNALYDCAAFPVSMGMEYIITEPGLCVVLFYSAIPSTESLISVLNLPAGGKFITPEGCNYIAIDFLTKEDINDYKTIFLSLSDINNILQSIIEIQNDSKNVGMPFTIGLLPLKAYNIMTGNGPGDSEFYDSVVKSCDDNTVYKLLGSTIYINFYNGIPSADTFISSLDGSGVDEFTTPENCTHLTFLYLDHPDITFYESQFLIKKQSLLNVHNTLLANLNQNVSEISNDIFVISKENKPLTKFALVGDSLTANEIGGNIPTDLDEGSTMRPMRLLTNNFPRRLYDAWNWNKPKWRRLDHADWTKSAFATFDASAMFEGTQEVYHKAETLGAYIEIVIPSGYEHFALLCHQLEGLGKLNVTLNGGAIGTFENPYYNAKVETNIVVTSSIVPELIAHGPSQIDLNKTGSSITGNPYHVVEFNNLPSGQANTLRFTCNDATQCNVWGGFYWTGNTMVVINIAHGGHTTTDLMDQHLQDELYDENYDHIIFEVPIMNNLRLTLAQTQTDLEAIILALSGKDVVFTSCNMGGLSITYDCNMWILPEWNDPNMVEINDRAKTVMVAKGSKYIDILDYFIKLTESRGGTLNGGEGGLWYTHDGQHGNEAGCREWFNILVRMWPTIHHKAIL